jgi:hypothetical protein
MLTSLPHPRYERKCLVRGLSLPEVTTVIHRHPAVFREAYPARWVNNVYFDTHALNAYYDHIHGISERVKHRVRWYGPFSSEVPKPVLERKYRQGSVGGKASDALSGFELNGHPVGDCLESALERSALPERLRAEIHHLQPTLLNRYRRRYFVSASGRFRLTVDSELQFGKASWTHPRLAMSSLGAPLVVIELKFDLRHADEAAAVTNAFPFGLTRCSKYVLGMQST